MKQRLWAVVVAVALLVVWPRAQATVGADGRTPSLVVVLMVDQFRADYIDRYSQQWSHGLRRLLNDGAWFRQAQYPYANTVTCAGHATVSTGSLPSVHGLIMNDWWDAGGRKEVTCTEDPSVTTISYGLPVKATGESLVRLRVPTLADELRAQLTPPSRSIAFSLKARSAAPLSGHHPDAVAWFDDSGAWVTSTAFSAGPVPEVADYVRRHPIDADFSKVWDRALPVGEYLFESPAIGLGEIRGRMTAAFPHLLASAAQPDRDFYTRWQSSPYADEYLAQMTIDIARRMRIGSTPRSTDLIGVSFSTLDKVGHDYGPHSHEVQDVLIRLDRTLGDFFGQLDQFVGAGNYVVALTADHGVAPIPERARQFGIDAGRLDNVMVVRSAELALSRALGRGSHVSRMVDTELYLQPGVYARLREQPEDLQSVRDALRSIEGIQAVYTRDELEGARAGDDPMAARLARSHFPGRSGDLTLVTKPYWIVEASGTSHGTGYGYDTHVPLLLMGKGITPGEYLGAASPLDVAPTLAFLANVTLASSQGRVLSEAISALPATHPGATR